MKKSILILFLFSIAGIVSAQKKTQGVVLYEELQKLNIQLEGDASQFAHALPKERKSSKQLFYNEGASIYKKSTIDEDSEDVTMQQGGASVEIKMVEPDNQFYIDLKNNKTVEKREFMTRNFLISGEQDGSGWKITDEQKNILGYACHQATKTTEDSTDVVAWFCSEIAIPTGPQNFIGLPGLVLEVDINDGDRVILAKEISFVEAFEEPIKKPKKGKKVTQEEFDQIVKEKMEEMGAQGGGEGATFIMRIER